MSANGDNAGDCVAMWRAVISQAITDATGYFGDNIDRLRIRDQARAWLSKPNDNFALVCEYADLQPSQVRAMAIKTIAESDANSSVIAARSAAASERIKRGYRRKMDRAGVANFSNDEPDQSFPSAQDRM